MRLDRVRFIHENGHIEFLGVLTDQFLISCHIPQSDSDLAITIPLVSNQTQNLGKDPAHFFPPMGCGIQIHMAVPLLPGSGRHLKQLPGRMGNPILPARRKERLLYGHPIRLRLFIECVQCAAAHIEEFLALFLSPLRLFCGPLRDGNPNGKLFRTQHELLQDADLLRREAIEIVYINRNPCQPFRL